MTHSQNANGFVCGLSTRKMRTPCSIQKRKTILQLRPQRAPFVGLEIERDRCPVLLRRILGILNRAVRPRPKPLAMLRDVRMIRRALEGDIQRDFQAVLLGLLAINCSKSSQCAQLRMDRGVAALFEIRSPRDCRHRPVRPATELFFALAKGLPDRMNRREGRQRRSPSTRCREARPRNRAACRAARAQSSRIAGNISYQVEKRAFSRSTTTSSCLW